MASRTNQTAGREFGLAMKRRRQRRNALIKEGKSIEQASRIVNATQPKLRTLKGKPVEFKLTLAKSLDRTAARIIEGLDATQLHTAAYQGKISDTRTSVDFKERRETAKLIAQITGQLEEPSKSNDVNVGIAVRISHVGGIPD